ncbi:WD40 repeat domain-containing protein [Parafrankia sp. FMc2]|uniref:WD40 repeat domain-containing protein n=1 Tax=Parafrankia sp. FMc2 TaxID=3233196 RepID=UPI0034D7507E
MLSRASRSVWVAALAFVSGGEILATGADDGSTRLWDVADLSRTRDILRLNDHRGWVRAVACAPRDSLLMTAGEDGVVVARDIRHATVPGDAEVMDEHGEPVWAMAFDPRTGLLATADDSGRVCLRPVARYRRDVRPAPGSVAPARPAAAARSVDAGESTRLLIGDRPAGALAFSPCHPVLACGSADGTVSLWPSDGSATRPAHLLTDHDDGVWAVAYSPDGSRLATGSDDGTVRLWDVENPAGPVCVARADHGGRRVRTVAFSPDGTLLVAGGDGDVVRVWDLRRGDVPSLAVAHHGVGGRVLAAAFAPRPPAVQLRAGEGAGHPYLLALGCADGRVRLYRIVLEDT